MTNNETLKNTLGMIKAIRRSTGMKVNRYFADFFADRITQSFTKPSLIDAIEHLATAVDVKIEFINSKTITAFMKTSTCERNFSVLLWIRQHPKVAAMVVGLRDDQDYIDAVNSIIVPDNSYDNSYVAHQPQYQISINAELLSPLSHGSDTKAGNATLFRRQKAITNSGNLLSLPFYSGNAVRGKMRDLMADHFAAALGLIPRKDKPPFRLWFFHSLYAGGVLEEGADKNKKLAAQVGMRGAVNTDGLRELRDNIPLLSVLGSALGNKILAGRVQIGHLRPCCKQWGNGNMPVDGLMAWEYLTRRDDYEGRGEEDGHKGMIATTECLAVGATLRGGIDYYHHATELDLSALGCALSLLAENGMLGGQNARGFGKVRFDIKNAPDPTLYLDFLHDNKQQILDFMASIGAIDAPN